MSIDYERIVSIAKAQEDALRSPHLEDHAFLVDALSQWLNIPNVPTP